MVSVRIRPPERRVRVETKYGTSAGAFLAWETRRRNAKPKEPEQPKNPRLRDPDTDTMAVVEIDPRVEKYAKDIIGGVKSVEDLLANPPVIHVIFQPRLDYEAIGDPVLASTNGATGRISLYPDFRDHSYMVQYTAKTTADFDKIDRWVVTTDRAGIVAHEYGHLLWTDLAANHYGTMVKLDQYLHVDVGGEQLRSSPFAGEGPRMVHESIPRLHDGTTAPSTYAMTNKREYVAESVADVARNGDKARATSRAVVDIIREAYA